MAESTRKYRTKLRVQYLDRHKTHEDKLKKRLPEVRLEDWEEFIKNNVDPKTIEQCKKNTEIRKKMEIYHTSGRHVHASLEEKMKRQKKKKTIPRVLGLKCGSKHIKERIVLSPVACLYTWKK